MTTLQERMAEVFPRPIERGRQAEIAKLCDVKPASVSAWFKNPEKVTTISRTNAEKLCSHFKLTVNPAWLAEGLAPKFPAGEGDMLARQLAATGFVAGTFGTPSIGNASPVLIDLENNPDYPAIPSGYDGSSSATIPEGLPMTDKSAALQPSILDRLETQQQHLDVLTEQVAGINLANQVILELLLSASPAQKQVVAEGLSQLLNRPELVPNSHTLEILNLAHQCAQLPSRATPEGRRSWLYPVASAKDAAPQS